MNDLIPIDYYTTFYFQFFLIVVAMTVLHCFVLEINENNKCHFLSSPIESPHVVNDDQAEAIGMDVHPDIRGFVDEDLLASADVNIAVDNVQDAAVDVDLLADVDVVLAVYDDTAAIDHAQVDEDLLADVCINLRSHQSQFKHIQRPATSLVGGREEVGTAKQQAQLIQF